jgi:hypothetical protein
MSEPYWEPLAAAPFVAGPRHVTGKVNNAGVIVAGTGFSVVKNSTGTYTITFTTPFPAAPVVFLAPLDFPQAVGESLLAPNPTATGFGVALRDNTNAALNAGFNFVAIEML